jgi:hypothetical protein
LEAIVAICTGFSMPTSIGPMTAVAAQFAQQLGREIGRLQPRHDQHVGRAGQAAERIVLHHRGIERHVGRHLALILEVDTAFVEDRHRIADRLQPVARGLPKVE